MKTKILFALLLGASVWVGCDKAQHLKNPASQKESHNKPPKGDDSTPCDSVACTMQFEQVHLQVLDASGAPVILDAFHTEDMTGAKLPASLYEYDNHTKAYVVFNDNWVPGHQNSTTTVRFVGFKNGAKVVQEDYNISTDCCHISKTSGKNRVVLSPNGECDGVVCTMQFEQVRLQVLDAGGKPVTLDAFHTEDMTGAKLPTNLYEYDDYTKSYVVFNDSWVPGHQNSTTTVRFVGFKNGTKVVQEDYSISTDCCHVSKTSGKDRVVLP